MPPRVGGIAKCDKRPRPDQARDLARENLVVSPIQQSLFEQEAGRDVIALVLKLCGVALALGCPFAQLDQLARACHTFPAPMEDSSARWQTRSG